MEITKRVDSRKLTFEQRQRHEVVIKQCKAVQRLGSQKDSLLAHGQHMVEVLLDLHMD